MSSRALHTKRKRNVVVAVSLGAIAVALGMVLSLGGVGVLPPRDARALAKSIALNSYNPWNRTLTSYSLNAVSAVIWDYRGIDTVFETAVLLSAVTGVAVLFHGALEIEGLRRKGMSRVAKESTKIVILLTMLIAVSTAVHGHLTPGGGFQGGAIAAVSVALATIVFSIEFLYDAGFKKDALLKARYAVLTLMILVALVPLVSVLLNGFAYIMQNQVKEGSAFSMPPRLMDTPLAGSIFAFNVLECLAIALALSYVVLIFAKRREELEAAIDGEGS